MTIMSDAFQMDPYIIIFAQCRNLLDNYPFYSFNPWSKETVEIEGDFMEFLAPNHALYVVIKISRDPGQSVPGNGMSWSPNFPGFPGTGNPGMQH